MARVTKSPDVRRRELITCAQNLFYTKGYENTSVSDIVAEVGVAKGTFYYYFDSKLAILEAAVEDLAEQSLALLQGIGEDSSLSATQKWVTAVQLLNNFKVERKEEMLAIVRALYTEENTVLQFKLQEKGVQLFVPEFATIIAQGVQEGLFDVEYASEAAEITYAIQNALSKSFVDILLNPQSFADPQATARRKVTAMQSAVERVLGAAPDSLPLIDPQSFSVWFEDKKELVP